MKMRKIKALITKDIRILSSNMSLFSLLLLPIIFGLIYKMIMGSADAPVEEAAYIILQMTSVLSVGIIGSAIVATAISDEKEKKTLRSLMLSDVSGIEFIFSKIIVVLFLSLIVNITCFILSGVQFADLPIYLLLTTLATLSLMLMSAVLGLYANNQQAAGLYTTPLMLISMIPMFFQMSHNRILHAVSEYTPTGPVLSFLTSQMLNEGSFNVLHGLIILFVWILIFSGIFVVAYRQKSLDN